MRRLRRLRRHRPKASPVSLAVLLIAVFGLAAGLYTLQYRPDRQTDADVAHAVTNAASEGTVALLSYSPDTLDQDFSTAKSHLTGDFLDYYNQFTTQVVMPTATQKAVKTTARVVRAAITELHRDNAVVLVFIAQSTTSKEKPDPAMTSSTVLVTLHAVDKAWLISAFDPV